MFQATHGTRALPMMITSQWSTVVVTKLSVTRTHTHTHTLFYMSIYRYDNIEGEFNGGNTAISYSSTRDCPPWSWTSLQLRSSCSIQVKTCPQGDTVERNLVRWDYIPSEFLNTPNRSPPELLLQVNVTFSLTVVQRTCQIAKNISVTGKNKILISAALVIERKHA